MNEAQNASNNEEKSSAGDKFETSRAMGQRDRDMYAKQLFEAKLEWQKLIKTNLEPYKNVKIGSLVDCDKTYYFVAVGIGKVIINEKNITILSPQAPLAKMMLGKEKKDSFSFNEKIYTINNIY